MAATAPVLTRLWGPDARLQWAWLQQFVSAGVAFGACRVHPPRA